MYMAFKPNGIARLWTPAELLIPTGTTKKNGVNVRSYPENGTDIFISFKTFGGTEQTVNGVFSILDTAQVVTWYRSDIKADCRIRLADGSVYEIIGTPENINMENLYLMFKVQRLKGGA